MSDRAEMTDAVVDVAPEREPATGGGHGGSARKPGHGGGGGGHGDGGHEEHEGAPEWLISFADNVMLQMGFFVILFSLASLKAPGAGGPTRGETGPADAPVKAADGSQISARELDWAIAVRAAFHNPVSIDSKDPRDALLVQRLRLREHPGAGDAHQQGLNGREHDVQSIRQTGAYGTGGLIPFDDASAAINESGRAAVLELARQFRGCHTVLELRGHCSAAEAYGQPDRAMQLSYERARAVGELLVAEGLKWEQIRLTACADNDRATPTAYDATGQRTNQRVEVIEIRQAAPLEESATPASMPARSE